jgi:hypothetical protein
MYRFQQNVINKSFHIDFSKILYKILHNFQQVMALDIILLQQIYTNPHNTSNTENSKYWDIISKYIFWLWDFFFIPLCETAP